MEKNTRGQDKTEGWEIGAKKEKSEEKEGRGEEGEPEAGQASADYEGPYMIFLMRFGS